MSDETPQAPVTDTPAVEADTRQVDWEKRYNDLQPEYTRKSQRLSQLESDPSAVLEWVQQYHPDLIDGEEEQDDGQGYEEETDDPRWAELNELKTWKQEQETRQQAEETRQEWAGWEAYVKQEASTEGIELSSRDIKALKLDSADKNGRPVAPEQARTILQDAIKEVQEYEQAVLERARKNRKRVPLPPGDGKTATSTPNLDDPRERVAWMTEQANLRGAD